MTKKSRPDNPGRLFIFVDWFRLFAAAVMFADAARWYSDFSGDLSQLAR
jgi:hypothetical protein